MSQPRPFILAIDDDRGRYDGLRQMLSNRARVVMASCPGCVVECLEHCDAVLLDHDLNGRDNEWNRLPCTRCGGPNVEKTSRWTLPHIAARGVPVIVTSGSHVDNRRWLYDLLHEAGVTVTRYAATGTDGPEPETFWIGWLWRQGVL